MGAPKRNLFALGNNGGRPPKYKTAEEVFKKCKGYFDSCIELEEKATITGLALFLGFAARSSLYDYANKEEFSYVIKNAMLVIENSYENSGTAFDIFALKNMGWSDKTEVDHTTKGKEVGPPAITFVDFEKLNSEE